MQNSNKQQLYKIFKNKEFLYFIITRFALVFSLFLINTVVSYKLYTITKDPLSLGLIGLFEVIPAFICAFFAGYFVDKNEKRWIYFLCIIGYVLNGLLFLYATSNYFTGQHSVRTVEVAIYSGMFISGILRAFISPASFSLMPLLVKTNEISVAVTWTSTSWLLGSVMGPLVGGLLLAWIGITYSIQIAILTLLICGVLILQIKRKPITFTKDVGIVKGLAEGFRFVFGNQIILAVISLDLFAVLFGGAEALLPVVAKDILDVGEIGYGWLRSAHGIGSIFLLLVLAYIPLKSNVGKKLFVSVGLYGLCILLFGISSSFVISFGLLFMAGLFDGVSVVIRQSILQIKTPSEIKGRVSSINMMFISSSNELGAFESGFAARLMGTIPAIIFGGIMTIIVVLSTFLFAPKVRKLNSLDE
ncbi:MAG: MFS transporter [Chitinophagaceae bacterium]|nr:MFS transporter [Chitinophagaceae bacterium]